MRVIFRPIEQNRQHFGNIIGDGQILEVGGSQVQHGLAVAHPRVVGLPQLVELGRNATEDFLAQTVEPFRLLDGSAKIVVAGILREIVVRQIVADHFGFEGGGVQAVEVADADVGQLVDEVHAFGALRVHEAAELDDEVAHAAGRFEGRVALFGLHQPLVHVKLLHGRNYGVAVQVEARQHHEEELARAQLRVGFGVVQAVQVLLVGLDDLVVGLAEDRAELVQVLDRLAEVAALFGQPPVLRGKLLSCGVLLEIFTANAEKRNRVSALKLFVLEFLKAVRIFEFVEMVEVELADEGVVVAGFEVVGELVGEGGDAADEEGVAVFAPADDFWVVDELFKLLLSFHRWR